MGRKKREPAEVVDHKKQRAEALASLRAKRTKRVSLGGDGLTELSALTIPDGVEITEQEAHAAMFESFMPPDWQADLAGISEQCAEVLKREGLSHPEWTVLREGEHAANVSQIFSDAWFAGRISKLAYLIRLADRDGVSAEPSNLTRILDLGYLLGDWSLRRQIRKDALRGKDVPRNASEGGKKTSLERHVPKRARVLAEMSRMMAGNPSISAWKAAGLAAKDDVGTSQDANYGIWKRYRPRR